MQLDQKTIAALAEHLEAAGGETPTLKRIIVGGAPFRFDPELHRKVEADAWAEDGITAAKVIADLVREAS